MRKIVPLFLLLVFVAGEVCAQNKQAMTLQQLQDFKRTTNRQITADGKWVLTVTEPWRGDGSREGVYPTFQGDATAKIYNAQGELVKQFKPVSAARFSASSKFAVIQTKQTEEEQRAQQLKNQQKKDKKNRDEKKAAPLHLYALNGGEEVIDSVRNFQLSDKSDWLAYQVGQKDSTLYVRRLGQSTSTAYGSVTDYRFAKNGKALYFVVADKGEATACGLYILTDAAQKPLLVKQGKGYFTQVTFSKDASQLAFLYCEKKKEADKGMSLWLSKNGQEATLLADSQSAFLTKDWIVSEHGRVHFSDNGLRLFFGTAPKPQVKDTLQLTSERPNVQVWKWNEPTQYTVQEHNKLRDAKKTYEAVCELSSKRVMQLANQALPNLTIGMDGNSEWALLSTSEPYSVSSMWEGRSKSDTYVVSLASGDKRLLKKADYTRYRISPAGRYAYAYSETDSIWRTIELANGKEFILTTPQSFAAWDSDNDVPDYPRAYGLAGWTANDEALLLYSRYDIWQCAAQGGVMQNLTLNGERNRVAYRLLRLEEREEIEQPVDLKKTQLLLAFNEQTKGAAYYATSFKKPAEPKLLLGGDFGLNTPIKAKNANVVLFTKESFEYYPDAYLSNFTFKNPIQITHEVEQQAPYIWGTAELISWITYKGVKTEGVIYKPANFDPNKKYPLMVNFYERNAETLHDYRMPQPHRSSIDYHFYTSNGYVVFNPDIHYVDGHPGESCYDCVMSGMDEVIKRGYVDEQHIGASGHSWGGYQTAYLATRTNRFAAIESGAPVVNMFSAYGGIRWGSGMARAFQYEHTQSRIGASIWEAPELYKENSSLFTMDKVNTPILIMHNDADGHVPWYQGIEYFVALKRLGKPCWMLNYVGEPHWPVKMANRLDFQTRMFQFFNHYLKGEAMPKWMREGVKAVEQPFELGYE